MQKMRVLCFVMGVIAFFWSESAICNLERDFQTWTNIFAIAKTHSDDKILKHVRFWLEGQERLGKDSSRTVLALVRPGLGYAINDNWSLWLGYAWIYTPIALNREEDRSWQQLLWVKTYHYLNLTNRLRTEQRFFENNPRVAYRVRELVKFSLPFKPEGKLSLVSSDEVFYYKNNYLGKNGRGFDQNRFFIGLGYRKNKTVNVEIGYMNQYIHRISRPNFLAHIISSNLLLNF